MKRGQGVTDAARGQWAAAEAVPRGPAGRAGRACQRGGGMAALYACTKCHQRFPFEALSQGQQLCKVQERGWGRAGGGLGSSQGEGL